MRLKVNIQLHRAASVGLDGCKKENVVNHSKVAVNGPVTCATAGRIKESKMGDVFICRVQYLNDLDPFMEYPVREPPRALYHTFNTNIPLSYQIASVQRLLQSPHRLDDAALQVFKDGEYGSYLDLDSTLAEQEEDLEGVQDSRKNAIVLRTQLSVRVHTIIERLLHSQGRELRRALFTLKQILQSDKDLLHEFVANKGLDCLMQVGNVADHNYLDYILRALGQILLYVDGMHGVMENTRCVQWLYSLVASKFRHVVKISLKLILVFVEYTESNCLLLMDAINFVDSSCNNPPWHNIMKIFKDAADTELLIYAMTLINRCLNHAPDSDTYYNQVDALQDQGIDEVIQMYMSKQGTDLDLLRQFQIFEAVLQYEDGDELGTALKQLDDSTIYTIQKRIRGPNTIHRRRSKKQMIKDENANLSPPTEDNEKNATIDDMLEPAVTDNKENKFLSTSAKRRRERSARQANHIFQQQELVNNNAPSNGMFVVTNSKRNATTQNNYLQEDISKTMNNLNIADAVTNGNQRYTSGLKQRIQNGTLGHTVNAKDAIIVIRQKKSEIGDVKECSDMNLLLNREHSIKDLAQRLTNSGSQPQSPEEKPSRISDLSGVVMKAKEGLAKSQSKEVIKSPTNVEIMPKHHEIKASENELHWEELKKSLNRDFYLCDIDFTDLICEDEDILLPAVVGSAPPPPPPPGFFGQINSFPPPPPPGAYMNNKPDNSTSLDCVSLTNSNNDSDSSTIRKNKKTVKLFWKEINENALPVTVKEKVGGLIWDDLPEISLDTKSLEHLFESKSNDLLMKKLNEPKKNLILDTKRSNAINIGMKKLPTPQTIKAAIMKMDATVIGREGIEKLLTMLPTEEEKIKIQEAQYSNPGLPLGSAEQFLLALASISELSSRLKLWLFKLDFENAEREIAEPLNDLRQGLDLLKVNKTFKAILSTLRSVGSFLNGSQVKGFRLEYLSKVMEVKDTVHKHPLLYHICEMIIEKFPDTSDFFSEVGPIIRASKVDFEVLDSNLNKLETDCKASWDHLKLVAKHDGPMIAKTKVDEFLTDAAERIIMLGIIKKGVMNRYNKFLLYIGVPFGELRETKPSAFLKVLAEFALEYRTSRERVLQQMEKRANHRERNKTRGKMIIDLEKTSKSAESRADEALKELLMADGNDTSTLGRKKSTENRIFISSEITPEDEIFKSLVKSTSSRGKPVTRERKRARLTDKKYNRTLDGNMQR